MEHSIDFEGERKRLTRWAWGVTIGYGCILIVLAALVLFGEEGLDSFRTMSPNEVGDLLAGIAGPLAFMWLVYGYFLQGIAIKQQAEELRQNTLALKLQHQALVAQVVELRKSVEHQQDMVTIGKKQIENDDAALLRQQEAQRRAALPRFIFSSDGVQSGANYSGVIYASILENIGNVVTDVKISCSKDINSISPRSFMSFEAKARHRLQWQSVGKDAASESWILIEYIDTLGIHGKQKFQPIAGENGLFTGAVVSSD